MKLSSVPLAPSRVSGGSTLSRTPSGPPAALDRPVSDLPRGYRAAVRSLRPAALALLDLLGLLYLCVAVCLVPVVIGLTMLPGALNGIRVSAQRQRAAASRDSGVAVSGQYRREGTDRGWLNVGPLAQTLADPTVQKDLVWTLMNPVVGLLLSTLSLGLLVQALQGFGFALALTWYSPAVPVFGGGLYGDLFLQADLVWPFDRGLIAAVMAVLLWVLGWASGRPLLRAHGLWVRAVLHSETNEDLLEHVDRLRATRRDALDLQETEIERIERDLHDGAQARLVALGMTLGQASRLVHQDPDRAVQVLGQAKGHATTALAELRRLVRGIRPPVLADRGLVPALRALAEDTPVPTRVRSDLDHRLAAPLETALYFAVAELITNAVKHAEASLIEVDVTTGGLALPGQIALTVTDDGRGSAHLAAPHPGHAPPSTGGLDGVRRRLAAFDGELHLSSPEGGPTVAWVLIPDVHSPRPESP